MSGRSHPKASMKTRLPNGDYLMLAVWPGRSDPTAEVITVQVRPSRMAIGKLLVDWLPIEQKEATRNSQSGVNGEKE